MITIDQGKIDAPDFPRSQAWWAGFVPVWVTATVRDDGTVTLETSGRYYRPSDGQIMDRELTAAQRRNVGKSLARWVGNLPRLAAGIITEGEQS